MPSAHAGGSAPERVSSLGCPRKRMMRWSRSTVSPMIPLGPLDELPIWANFLLFVGVSLGAFEAGYRLARRWDERFPGRPEALSGLVVGSLIGLLAFILAITMSM